MLCVKLVEMAENSDFAGVGIHQNHGFVQDDAIM